MGIEILDIVNLRNSGFRGFGNQGQAEPEGGETYIPIGESNDHFSGFDQSAEHCSVQG